MNECGDKRRRKQERIEETRPSTTNELNRMKRQIRSGEWNRKPKRTKKATTPMKKSNNTHEEKKQGLPCPSNLGAVASSTVVHACVTSVKVRNSREQKYFQNQGDAVKHSCNRQRGNRQEEPRERRLGMAPHERGQRNGRWGRVRVRNC
jgi:hypothetical protein